jgi:hypothetical protein
MHKPNHPQSPPDWVNNHKPVPEPGSSLITVMLLTLFLLIRKR